SFWASAPTRSASALFQVKPGSSKLPETCSTNRSLCSRAACSAASLGLGRNATAVPQKSPLALHVAEMLGSSPLDAGIGISVLDSSLPAKGCRWITSSVTADTPLSVARKTCSDQPAHLSS